MKREIRKLYKSGNENNEFNEEPPSSEEEKEEVGEKEQSDRNSDDDDDEKLDDELYDEVEDDILNQLLKYTSREDLRKTLKRIKRSEISDWNDDDDDGDDENKKEAESSYDDENESDYDLSSSTGEEIPFIDEIDNKDLQDDIEQNRDVLRHSLAKSIIKPPSISPPTIEKEEGHEKANNYDNKENKIEKKEGIELKDFSKIKKKKKSSSSSSSLKSSSSSSSLKSSLTESSIKSILKKSTKNIEKAKRYLIPPKLLMEMDDIELIREDICAVDRSLAGYSRTGMAVIGLGVGLISKLGFTTSTIIVTIAYFLFGLVLIAVGLTRCRTVIKYIKKGYMKPSIYSIVIITLSTLMVIGFSFYGVVSSS
ncbi:hypothetical protein DDB_G0292964 [Dictyostelium discoideum AX4]|uniref:DUF202 domain-containing protein n=1 Tax=Dictyostelium discoideum TaxID=44689 RepID=Q54CN3_DICDI|nr:hypothetical protein DDB_G0292964 [Dictyostelium discoideum AX4]EAL61031.1 hypothetical protein DDB_G0292964 [Dictyostelium discoideum AX4]|eukprot:XP_629383.1 hypothetical protein DDB_G0292964 [Dictyostelium discoideum AX4]